MKAIIKTLLQKLKALQPMIFNVKNISVMCIIAILLIALMVKSCELNRAENLAEKRRIPDTVYVSKPYKVVEIRKEYIEKPVKVYVYLKDTSLRREAEHSDIITGIDIKRANLFHRTDFLRVDRITPLGIVLSNEYQLPAFREVKIDMHANVQVKKKRFTKLKKAVGIILTVAAGIAIGAELHK
jgi:hypothetical protein